MDIVTCDRGVGRRTPFIRKKDCDRLLSQPFLQSNYTNSCGLIDGSFFFQVFLKASETSYFHELFSIQGTT